MSQPAIASMVIHASGSCVHREVYRRCLFFQTTSQKAWQLGSNVSGWVQEAQLSWGYNFRGQSHNVWVSLQTTHYCRWCCVHKPRFNSGAMLTTQGFLCVTSPCPLAAGSWAFPGVRFCTLVSAGIF